MKAAFIISVETLVIFAGTSNADRVDFTRDVRPILSRVCFKCHGPDEQARKAKLRLDVRDPALHGGRSGEPAIVPGKPEESELVRRILATEDDIIMPPPAVKKPLSASDKQILKQWIAEGAEYKPHWAFVAPRQTKIPSVKLADWPRNPIDYFVLYRLEMEGLQPSAAADRYTLVRRLYLDLIGLPPTPEEADAFVNDRSANAYSKLVDLLLASPHYGERWARRWLDLARYADTNGYEKDRVRSIWPYRDWVLKALNRDLPFNEFTIEQIAGDMLPEATLDQRIATGFHRNTMLNEEGGIDPLEFRYYAMTDRVATTATAWLGLTLGCAQCHTHKYDPIPQRDYYRFMAFLDNTEERQMDIPRPALTLKREAIEKQIAARIADLPNRFPAGDGVEWQTPRPVSVISSGGATATVQPDASVLVSGKNPERDTFTIVMESHQSDVTQLRLETLADSSLPHRGPGRTPHGNFVLSEITVSATPLDTPTAAQPIKLAGAMADFAQDGFPAMNAIDGKVQTGWAIHGKDPWNVNRTATFMFDKPAGFAKGTRWTIRLDQQHGSQHTIGRFRLSLGRPVNDPRPMEVRRQANLTKKFEAWLRDEAKRAVHWHVLRPTEAKSNLPLLRVLGDNSILVDGDMTKRDIYDLNYHTDFTGITAVRLEVLPDDSLPRRGPGRVYYEGAFGDFFLSEFTVEADGKPIKFRRATQTRADGANTAAAAIDGDPKTGWSINGGQGEPQAAVFNLATPLGTTKTLHFRFLFEKYFAAALGRFRISVTTDKHAAEARGFTAELEDLVKTPPTKLNPAQREQLFHHFLATTPDLAVEHEAIKKLRNQEPAYPTTLVMAERPNWNPRPTFVHHRGEFLQPTERVQPDVLSALPGLSSDSPQNRLGFARWLVDPRNPLVSRVIVNRHWAAFFGQGIVRTQEDFGFQGEPPTRPELLDWLAVELIRRGWSIKELHRLIVTSATYQQDARVSPRLLEKDPQNRLLARSSRFRLEGELVRDGALKAGGLLAQKIGGPSVFPPQPPGVSSEGAYGPLSWNVSKGLDRYRRGLYTFSKRTAPYAMFTTFDAPSGEACVARREVSNTPLQALTLLNDPVFMEAAQALGKLTAERASSLEGKARFLFRSCLTRPPTEDELAALLTFYRAQLQRFAAKELDAHRIGGAGASAEQAAWTSVARVLLNLDEAITKG
jgi:hypothetical protein